MLGVNLFLGWPGQVSRRYQPLPNRYDWNRGTLVVDHDDSGRTVGAADPARLIEDLPNKISNLLGLVVPAQLRHEAGHPLIAIVVEASPYPVTHRDKSYGRAQELSGAALDAFLLRLQRRHSPERVLP